MDVVLEVAELGVERPRVASERHAVHQPQVAQRADHRQEVVEVALEVGELRLLAGGQPDVRRLPAEQQHGVPPAGLGVQVEERGRGGQLLRHATVEPGTSPVEDGGASRAR